jgi:pyruvate/2-oxoglutarate dehydrogenase complex dihydrolipoamide dehydrogenase (E3) component
MATEYDLIIVGMGSAGLVAAEFAATLDLKIAAVERDRVGGDCLWTGCVPSKALLASAKVAHHMRTAEEYGIAAVEPQVDSAKVWDRIHAVQQEIADTDDNPDRYRDMGVEFHFGHATLTGPHTVRVGEDDELRGRFILLCTGSRPVVPPIDGLQHAGFLTSENVWDLERAPSSLVAIGGGPISVEMSQAFQRLGVQTHTLQKGPGILPRDEPSLVEVLVHKLRGEGVDLRFNVETERVTVENGTKVVHGTEDGEPRTWRGEEILVGVGRRPNVEGLGLEELGIETNLKGVAIDERSRTTVPSVYAVGDLGGRYLFTHSAGYEAVRAIRDMFFPGKGKFTNFVPWCTFTDPELAHAGLTPAEAERQHGDDDVDIWRQDLTHSDRARAEGASEGAIIVVTHKKRVVGAHILAPAAGEMIHELGLAMQEGLKFEEVASLIHVYPTVSIGIAQLAGEAAFESAQRYRWLVKRTKG